MDASVWPATADDAQAVTTLMAGFRDHMGKDRPPDEEVRATVEALLEDPATDFLLAADGDADPAGVCQLRYRLSVWTGADDCWLEDLYVEGHVRRAGLGRALVEAAFERATARGCRRIELDVNEDNEGAIALYRSLGFTTQPKGPGQSLFMGRGL